MEPLFNINANPTPFKWNSSSGSSVPANALLDNQGNPILDENGNYILQN